jgi:CubicO group peptidase (beta-lactamase class C family)
MILNKGTFNGKRILSEAAIEKMQTPQTPTIPKKYTPKVAEGFEYGLGEWIQEMDDRGNSTVVSCPGLFGTWPFVDKCRGYAGIVFVKSLISEQKKELYLDIKKSIDEQITSTCN